MSAEMDVEGLTCSSCKLPIHRSEPMDHFGDRVAHKGKSRCVALLRDRNRQQAEEIERLLEQLADRDAQIKASHLFHEGHEAQMEEIRTAANALADQEEQIARNSYTHPDGSWPQDWIDEDPEGYQLWKAVVDALGGERG